MALPLAPPKPQPLSLPDLCAHCSPAWNTCLSLPWTTPLGGHTSSHSPRATCCVLPQPCLSSAQRGCWRPSEPWGLITTGLADGRGLAIFFSLPPSSVCKQNTPEVRAHSASGGQSKMGGQGAVPCCPRGSSEGLDLHSACPWSAHHWSAVLPAQWTSSIDSCSGTGNSRLNSADKGTQSSWVTEFP